MLEFENERNRRIVNQGSNKQLKDAADKFLVESIESSYSYNFSWLGIPIIQYPQDIVAMQELVWKVKPDLIIETGVAHGGSLILYASMLELIGRGKVIGIDIDIRPHNREAILSHPLNKRIKLIEGSSISNEVLNLVKQELTEESKVMVLLDSNHTHDHVLSELKLYACFVSLDSYLVVFDTIVEDLPPSKIIDRPWARGNNPKTAVKEFLMLHNEFEIDFEIQNKLLVTVAPEGYLKRIK